MTTHTPGLTPAETLADPKKIEGPHLPEQRERDFTKNYSKHDAQKVVKNFCKHNNIDLRGVSNDSLLGFFDEDNSGSKPVFFLKDEFQFIEKTNPTTGNICLIRDKLTSLES